MRIGCERRCRIELPDGALADRKRALLIAMRRLRPSESGAIQARHGEDLSACQSRPGDLDLRRRDPACHRETLAARIGACNGARQRGDLFRECGIEAGGPAQTVPDRVAGGARLAFGRPRTTAAAAVGPARFTPCCADHAVSQCYSSSRFVLTRLSPECKQKSCSPAAAPSGHASAHAFQFEAPENLAKHGVSFDAARLAFDDVFAIAREDRRRDYGEARYVLLGMVQDRLLAVAYTQRGARLRIISARLAEPRERRRYHEENS